MICGRKKCTGCGACVEVCKNYCVSLEKDKNGNFYPKIDLSKCTNCNLCKKVCTIDTQIKFKIPQKVYASWSSNETTREKSASGGIATEIFCYALDNNMFIMGTFFDRKKGVFYKVINSKEDIEWARDSKYVYSNMQECFKLYSEKLNKGIKCIFIGLPCQVLALKNFCNIYCPEKLDNLYTIDIICHGTPPFIFLDKHLTYIERKKKTHISKVHFRETRSEYNLSCYDIENKLIYRRNMHADDEYYRAFSVGLNFQECCYDCHFSKYERIADVSIGDYSGLGLLWKFEYNQSQVSVVMCMTDKGIKLIDKLLNRGQIVGYERPIWEPVSAPGQCALRSPTSPHPKRDKFLDVFSATDNYEKAVRVSLRGLWIKYRLTFPFIYGKKMLLSLLPEKMKRKLRKNKK